MKALAQGGFATWQLASLTSLAPPWALRAVAILRWLSQCCDSSSISSSASLTAITPYFHASLLSSPWMVS